MSNEAFAEQLREADLFVPVATKLSTDQQVIAKVTDGIYRNPVSAFRELIANAFDADASKVEVSTDEPKFDRISISDNGNGMSIEAISNLLHSIGGSAKRTTNGERLGISKQGNPSLSPNGRRLIGRIGIGLFSVSHLTRRFKIVTKRAGDNYQLVVSVVLQQFDGSSEDSYENGSVKVWKEPNQSLEHHGTNITLDGIRNEAKELLSSKERWLALRNAIEDDPRSATNFKIPTYHIGFTELEAFGDEFFPSVGSINGAELRTLPWTPDDPPRVRFEKFHNSICSMGKDQSATNIRLEDVLDEYLKLLWNLSLSLPLKYLNGHPYESSWQNAHSTWMFKGKDILEELEPSSLPILQRIDIQAPPNDTFDVTVDGVQLFRPLTFNDFGATGHVLSKPLAFFGSEDISQISQTKEFTGGEKLSFDTYFVWSPKIVPVEHQGVLIRIHGASGTLFDRSFLGYQTAELVRLRQISAEVFIREGFEGAVNIDRESLNISHPHYVFLAKYVHTALRRIASKQKSISASLRALERDQNSATTVSSISEHVRTVRQKMDVSDDTERGVVAISDSLEDAAKTDILIRSYELPENIGARVTAQFQQRVQLRRRATEAIGEVLAAYGVFQNLDSRLQKELLLDIYAVLVKLEED